MPAIQARSPGRPRPDAEFEDPDWFDLASAEGVESDLIDLPTDRADDFRRFSRRRKGSATAIAVPVHCIATAEPSGKSAAHFVDETGQSARLQFFTPQSSTCMDGEPPRFATESNVKRPTSLARLWAAVQVASHERWGINK